MAASLVAHAAGISARLGQVARLSAPRIDLGASTKSIPKFAGKRIRRVVTLSSNPEFATQQLAETAALDQLIDMLLAAKNSDELAQLVAQNIMSYDQRFWLRLATRSDSASSPEDKERLASLAKVVMCTAFCLRNCLSIQCSSCAVPSGVNRYGR